MENVLLIGVRGGIGNAIKKKLITKYKLDCLNSKTLDLSNDESINEYIKENKNKYNHIIFSAGINKLVSFNKVTKTIIKKTLDVNLLNFLVILSSMVKRNFKENYCSITMISSLYGTFGRKGRLPYVISKHALNGACKTLAIELGKENIRVNTVSPGFINTKLTKNNLSSKEIKNIERKIPLKKLGKPLDIANTVAFLMSKEAQYISGTDIIVDGGFSSGAFMGV